MKNEKIEELKKTLNKLIKLKDKIRELQIELGNEIDHSKILDNKVLEFKTKAIKENE